VAWPKRGTRKLVVNGSEFLWHYDACCIWCSDDVVTVGRAGAPYVLFIDPYLRASRGLGARPHKRFFAPSATAGRPRIVRRAAWRTALMATGGCPTDKDTLGASPAPLTTEEGQRE
jgi:hypothetical protein